MKVFQRELIVGAVSAMFFAAAFTVAQLVITPQKCGDWLQLTMPNDNSVFVNMSEVATVAVAGTRDGIPADSIIFAHGRTLTVRELPQKIMETCNGRH